eukprot:g7497.t1
MANFMQRHAPLRVHGLPLASLRPGLVRKRNDAVRACMVEALFALCSLPLGAARGGISKLNAGINGLLFFVACIGLYGSLQFRSMLILLHWLLVSGLVAAFALFVAAAMAFGSSNISGGNWILVVIYVFLLVDLAIAVVTRRFQVALKQHEAERRAQGWHPAAPPGPAGAGRGPAHELPTRAPGAVAGAAFAAHAPALGFPPYGGDVRGGGGGGDVHGGGGGGARAGASASASVAAGEALLPISLLQGDEDTPDEFR